MTVDIQELSNHSYIDHELSANLDSTDAFEGPEKLLEIWFYPSAKSVSNGKSLLDVEFAKWVEMLKLVNCEVLSVKKTPKMLSFLLSESSMFVYDHRLILKTCGTTTTLLCLSKLFEIVTEDLKWDIEIDNGKYRPYKVFYSRRTFMFPDKQKSVHKNWSDEVNYLNKFFVHGKDYIVGKDNEKHWKLYITKTNSSLVTSDCQLDEDETLEILMTGLGSESSKKFYHDHLSDKQDEGHLNGYEMTKKTKIDEIYQNHSANTNVTHDSFAFTPCGYSCNIILDQEYYYTLHVTPEKGWSYASFETNIKYNNNVEILNNVLNIFNPQEFCLTFFHNTNQNQNQNSLVTNACSINGYKMADQKVHDLEDYQLLYIRYVATQ